MSQHSVTADFAGIGGSTTTFGTYSAHPVADLFPLLRDVDSDGYHDLVSGVRDDGQIEPIVLDGNVIIDGRNRYLACIEAGVEPRFVQYKDLGLSMPPHDYAYERNHTRRHLTDDQRTAITAAFLRFDAEQVKHQRAAAGGKAGGKGRPKQLEMNSSQAVAKPKRAPQTRKKVAEAAGVSEHKAQQAINVDQHGSAELKQAVRSGKVTLAKAQPMLPKETPQAKAKAAPPRVTGRVRMQTSSQAEKAADALRSSANAIQRIARDIGRSGQVNRGKINSARAKLNAANAELDRLVTLAEQEAQ